MNKLLFISLLIASCGTFASAQTKGDTTKVTFTRITERANQGDVVVDTNKAYTRFWPKIDSAKRKLPSRYWIKQEIQCTNGTWQITTFGIDKEKCDVCYLYANDKNTTKDRLKQDRDSEYNAAMSAVLLIIDLKRDNGNEQPYEDSISVRARKEVDDLFKDEPKSLPPSDLELLEKRIDSLEKRPYLFIDNKGVRPGVILTNSAGEYQILIYPLK